MRLIFSRDRAAQLDLLLRSLERFTEHEPTRVIWDASGPLFAAAYQMLPVAPTEWALDLDFDLRLRIALSECPDQTVTFFCDDDIVFNFVPKYDLETWFGTHSERMMTVSLRLGMENKTMRWPGEVWDWTELPRTDYGFPGSIDGHTFRVKDVVWMIQDRKIPNPTMLETVLAERIEDFAGSRPMMGCFKHQCLVGVPVNRVSEASSVPFGKKFPQSAASLNKRFLNGQRINIDALDFSGVDGCHHEIKFEWEDKP